MTIAAISTTPSITTLDPTTGTSSSLPSTLQAVASNFNALGQALQSGDLSGAQQAFTSLLQSAPTTGASSTASQSSASTSSSASSSAGADLVSLGQALQSGNLAGAQQAFTNLQQAMQAAAPAGGHHQGGGAGKVGGASSGGASDGATTVTSQVTTPNANGTITITTTYADGSTSTTIEQNPAAGASTAVNTKPLDQRNAAQLLTLLSAQEQTQPT